MQFLKRIIIVGCLLTLSNAAFAAPLPSHTGYVNDFANILDSQTRAGLADMLTSFEVKTGDEVVVATVKSLDGRPVEDYAVDLYKTWGIGKKGKDNGVLILVAPNEREMRIEVGYGLEGVINDAMAGRIIRETMIPAFKEGRFDVGIVHGTQVVLNIIAKDAGIQFDTQSGSIDETVSPPPPKKSLLHRIGSVFMFLLLAYLFIRHPWLFLFFLSGMGGGGRGGRSGGFGGGFGGFGGGMSGGGGASGSW